MKEFRAFIGYKQYQLEAELDLKEDKIKNIETEKHKISIELAEKIEQKYSIDGWWLLTGKGTMLLNSTQEVAQETTNNGEMNNSGMMANHFTNSTVNFSNGSQHPKEVTNLEDDMLECYRALDEQRQEYYYHVIKADSLAQKIKNDE